MKYIIRKMYYNHDKEEKWLNEMASKGLSLIATSWFKYVFEDSDKDKYIYRVVMLGRMASHHESIKYLEFLKETGAEVVGTYLSWAYVRKKASLGEFEIYSDIDSMIMHNKRLKRLLSILACVQIIPIFFYVASVLDGYKVPFGIVLPPIVIMIGLIFTRTPIIRKINKLKTEKKIKDY